jgi:hypothetical protein
MLTVALCPSATFAVWVVDIGQVSEVQAAHHTVSGVWLSWLFVTVRE